MTLAHMLDNAEDRGAKRINQLYKILLETDRIEDMKIAMDDEEYLFGKLTNDGGFNHVFFKEQR